MAFRKSNSLFSRPSYVCVFRSHFENTMQSQSNKDTAIHIHAHDTPTLLHLIFYLADTPINRFYSFHYRSEI